MSDFIADALASGDEIGDIKNALISQGHSQDDIDFAAGFAIPKLNSGEIPAPKGIFDWLRDLGKDSDAFTTL